MTPGAQVPHQARAGSLALVLAGLLLLAVWWRAWTLRDWSTR